MNPHPNFYLYTNLTRFHCSPCLLRLQHPFSSIYSIFRPQNTCSSRNSNCSNLGEFCVLLNYQWGWVLAQGWVLTLWKSCPSHYLAGSPFLAHTFRILSLSRGKVGEPMTSCMEASDHRSVTCIVPFIFSLLELLLLRVLNAVGQLQVPFSQLRQLKRMKVRALSSEKRSESLMALYCLVCSLFLVFQRLVRSRQNCVARLLWFSAFAARRSPRFSYSATVFCACAFMSDTRIYQKFFFYLMLEIATYNPRAVCPPIGRFCCCCRFSSLGWLTNLQQSQLLVEGG